MSDVLVLGTDPIGIVAECDGSRYYLTPCCFASAKGLENYIGCRRCYREIDPALGGLPYDPNFRDPEGRLARIGIRNNGPHLTTVFGDGIDYDVFVCEPDRFLTQTHWEAK